jgi:hypothetical protein
VSAGGNRYHTAIPAGAREALTTGTWDATAALLDIFEEVRAVAKDLPYITGF